MPETTTKQQLLQLPAMNVTICSCKPAERDQGSKMCAALLFATSNSAVHRLAFSTHDTVEPSSNGQMPMVTTGYGLKTTTCSLRLQTSHPISTSTYLAIKYLEPRLVYHYIAAVVKPNHPPVVQYKRDHQNYTQRTSK